MTFTIGKGGAAVDSQRSQDHAGIAFGVAQRIGTVFIQCYLARQQLTLACAALSRAAAVWKGYACVQRSFENP